MAESVVSDVIARLLDHLGKSATEEFASYFGGKLKLKELQRTMKMIQARIYDAERKGECEGGALVREWLKCLKQILDRLEDLFNEVAMSDKELDQRREGKFAKSLHVLLSMSSHFKINKRVSCEAKVIMQELKAVTSDMFSLKLREHCVEEGRVSNLTNRRETHSFVLDGKVIGRDDDKRAVVGMIVNSDVSDCISVIPIIGIGGLGKTALAQLVFNDENVRNCFELKCWVCISHISSLEEVVRKILKSLTTDDCEQLSMEQLQSHLRGFFSGKKYLLVLDDVWDENRERWLSLKDLLAGCKHGSRIIVTSRSRVVAENIGTVIPYELGGLSEHKSWELFRNLAFKEGQEERNQDMISIGKEIVKKCANVPLAIRTIAAVLHSSDTLEEWEHFKDSELRHIEQKEDSIMWSLKLSFDHLPPHLKQCFAYCSLFPKGRTLYKQELTYLWMAQGLLGSLSGSGHCLDDVGHVYFMELLRRSFFQEVLRDEKGDIVGCKMHNLMHELAQMVAGDECLVVHGSTMLNTENIRHVRLFVDSSWKAPSWLLGAKQMRSFHLQMTHLTANMVLNVHDIFSSLRCLRSLDLEIVNSQESPQISKRLPSSIRKLKQLRYVRLSVPSETLPECITELQNLLTLDLRGCCNLRELPRGFSRMTSLRHLHLSNPVKLTNMPICFAQLTSLQALDVFIVAENNGLDSLASLKNLAGNLKIFFVKHHGKVLSRKADQILHRMKITDLVLRWFWSSWHQEAVPFGDNTEDDLVMQCTQPPPSLKRLQVFDWKGSMFPSWRMDLLPNLISVELFYCEKTQYLPCLGQLPHLRYLKLFSLHSLESIETDAHGNISEVFPSLSKLDIRRCSMLKSMPKAPILKSLILHELNGKLPQHIGCLTSLQELVLYKLPNLEPQLEWIGNLTHLRRLAIEDCSKLSAIPVIPYSLRQLDIRNCSSLKGISCALQHLLNLEEMEIECCEELDLWDTTDDDYDDVRSIISNSSKSSYSSSSSNLPSTAWIGLKSLRCLKLDTIQKLENLPADLASLTTLQKLCIRLPHLRVLPEWIGQLTRLHELFVGPGLTTLPNSLGNLTSLKKLTIWNCSELQRRYHNRDDEFRSLVQHIPHLNISGLVAQPSLSNGIVSCATLLPLPPAPAPRLM